MVSKINRSILFSFLFLGLATGNMFAATTNEKTKLEQAKEITGTIIKAGFNIAKIAIPTKVCYELTKEMIKNLNYYDEIDPGPAALNFAGLIAILCALHSAKNAYYPSKERQKIATKKSYWQGIKNGIHGTFVNFPRLVALSISAGAGTFCLYTTTNPKYDPAKSIGLALATFITTYVCADSLKHAS